MSKFLETKKKIKKIIESYDRKIANLQEEIIIMQGEDRLKKSNVEEKREKVKVMWKEEECYIELLRKILREERRINGESVDSWVYKKRKRRGKGVTR